MRNNINRFSEKRDYITRRREIAGFDIILAVQRDKLCNKTDEMHFS
jgi:hypothetical protein